MLLENTTIVSLQLSGNEFDDHAAKYLADAITANSRAEVLGLSYDVFGDQAGEVLSVHLAQRGVLQHSAMQLSELHACLRPWESRVG